MKKKIVMMVALWLCLLVTVTTHVWAAELETYELSTDGSVRMEYNPDTRTMRVYGNGKMDPGARGTVLQGKWYSTQDNFGTLESDVLVIESGVQFPDNSSSLFASFPGQIEIADDIDTSNVTNMEAMFQNTKSAALNVGNWDTSHVTNMRHLFDGSLATSLDVSRWNVSNVTTMEGMFYGMHAADLDLSRWDTSNVTEMSYMFYNSPSVNVNVSNWNTAKVTEMEYMFAIDDSVMDPLTTTFVTNPDVSNWDVSNVTTMEGMFYNAQAANPDVSKWNTSNLQYTYAMFALTKAADPDITNWDLSSVVMMSEMFYGAEKVKFLDFRQGGLSAVTDLGGMDNTKSLEEAWLSKMTAGSTDLALKTPFTIDYYDADGTIYKTETIDNQVFTISGEDAEKAAQIHLYVPNLTPDEPTEPDDPTPIDPDDPTPIDPTEPDVPEVPEKATSSGSWFVAPLATPAKDNDTATERHTAYLTGYPDGTVMAEGDVTRGEAAAMVLRLAGKSLTHDDAVYHDVDANAWYSDYVLTAKALSMLDDKDGKLRPNDAITRGEFAAMLAVLDKDSTEPATFSDIDGHKYEAAIEKIAGNKRIIGYDDGTFRPDATLTRGEAVTILNRMFDRVADGVAVEDHSELKAFADLNVTDWYYYEIVEAANTHELERRGGIDAFGRQLENWTDVIDTAR
ncbi:BspA family leucine-rich repeat surface protein [Peptoniphilus equinus]|uniref:BspA family leucine-rich repeat surface protein n=1 Tax=Peptoniphilus equinus TaxID=3016343 RepID=A0ABY7QVR6_9FIRM|nr:BspA family leucine-rich repeat surface protein [Peptoniphilus equinus]WBW50355.1 BspA family leucine-rich repeat surface protein [Peptoniphilus equinus]